jgi:hypothetical protein
MKIPHGSSTIFPSLCLALAVAAASAADSTGIDKLQGVWSSKRTNQESQVVTHVLEIKKDRLTFKIVTADGETGFFAKGTVAVQKLGPFQNLTITDISAGRSEDNTEAVDDERASIFIVDGDTLTMASNFDKIRENQPPGVERYFRSKAAAKPADASAKLVGLWKMEVRIGENDADYELRLAQADGKLSATLISPRSGEHKVRQVSWADEKLTMELDRDYTGNTVTLVYTGKLEGDGLSGTVVLKGAEDQFSGTWKARK